MDLEKLAERLGLDVEDIRELLELYVETTYSDLAEFTSFVERFPGADLTLLGVVAKGKIAYLEKFVAGAAYWTINGVRREASEAETASSARDLAGWQALLPLVGR